jgi:hypothetical protein
MTKPTAQERRLELSTLSQALKSNNTGDERVNELVIAYYTKIGLGTEFHTYNQWREKGYYVNKGAVALTVWGTPVKGKAPKPETTEVSSNEYEYFPICYLFSDLQVSPMA